MDYKLNNCYLSGTPISGRKDIFFAIGIVLLIVGFGG